MRLLKSTTLDLHEFADNEIPEYAILSHRWGKDEVSFQDMQRGDPSGKAGYSKIVGCAKQAIADGCNYLWVDTCCIDKSSSAELSEAINSMFRWYRNAKVCYAYLSDAYSANSFRASAWHMRGWTLQELIAPATVVFYGRDWNVLGTKVTLQSLITDVTGVDREILLAEVDLKAISVSRKMYWAARRKTTRVEDLAYCLMGIFDVNMPLLYGEGDKAFIRLQEEIMKGSDDHTLFAWTNDVYVGPGSYCGLLASSPSKFRDSGHFTPLRDWNASLPFSQTNKGLFIQLVLSPLEIDREISLAMLDCESGARRIAIYLRCLSKAGGQYARVRATEIKLLKPSPNSDGKLTNVYIRQQVLLPTVESNDISGFCIQMNGFSEFIIETVIPENRWDPRNQVISVTAGNYAQVKFTPKTNFKYWWEGREFAVLLGIVQGSKGWCRVCEWSKLDAVLRDLRPEMQPISDSTYIREDKIAHKVARVRLVPEAVLSKGLLLVQVTVEDGSKLKKMLGFAKYPP